MERISVLVISPDRGLCGGMHANLNRRVGQFMLDQAVPVQVVAVGRKGRDFMVRSGSDLKAVFTDLGETPSLLDTLPISDMLVDTYAEADADEVYVAYTRFNSTLSQTPVVERLLPITPSELTGRRARRLHLRAGQPVGAAQPAAPGSSRCRSITPCWSPSPASSRPAMVAMRNATDNAKQLRRGTHPGDEQACARKA